MLTKAEIQMIRSLGDKKGRNVEGLFVAEGTKLVSELVVGVERVESLRVQRVLCTEMGVNHFERILPATRMRNNNIDIEVITHGEMDRISFLKTPSDMLALVEIPRHCLSVSELSGKVSLALDGVQDPGNMGTILRLADWFGVRNVICSETTVDCFNPKVVQATMGAIARVRVHYVPLVKWIGEVRTTNIPVYGTFLGEESIYDASLSSNGIIVMGSEGHGISPEVAALIERRLSIPPFPIGEPSSESLNVAMATAIICAEFRRRM